MGPWERVIRWLRGAPPVEEPGRYVPPVPTTELVLPSHGDAYDFTVRIRWEWSARGWPIARLADAVRPLTDDVWQQIVLIARQVLRSFPPHLPADAETALNRRLKEARKSQPPGSPIRWSALAEVRPHEKIRQQQQEAWSRRLRRAADQEMARIVIDDYIELTAKCRELLTTVGIGMADGPPPAFIGRYLVQLATDPTTAASVIDALSEHREEKDKEMLQAVVDAVHRSPTVNLMEADLAYDSALRRLMDWAGLPVPELTEHPVLPPSPNSLRDGRNPA
jgi:hypothetical protein